MKKLIKRILLVTLAISLVFCSLGCDSTKELPKGEDEVKKQVSVYYVDYGKGEMFPLLSAVDSQLPDISLKKTAFSTPEEFMTQVSTELAVGEGPDLIIFDLFSKLNYRKLAENQVLADLTDFLNSDESYQAENYYQPLLDIGKVNDGQYILPFAFDYVGLYTTKEVMEKYHYEVKKNYSVDEILEMLTNSVREAQKDSSVIPLGSMVTGGDILGALLSACNVPIIDHESKTVVLDKEVLKKFADFFREYYPFYLEAINPKSNSGGIDSYTHSASLEHTDFFVCNQQNTVRKSYLSSVYRDQFQRELVELKIPTLSDPASHCALLYWYVGVTENSQNKEPAYEVAKEIMETACNDLIYQKYPANKQVCQEWLNMLESHSFQNKLDNATVLIDVPKGTIESEKTLLESFDEATVREVDVAHILTEAVTPYLKRDTDDFDRCFTALINKLRLYVNE